ncbi:hypothetical protein GCM10027286_18440 [Virgibacillus ainsalahensis]
MWPLRRHCTATLASFWQMNPLHLDTDRAYEVMEMLQDLTKKRGKTTIVVTHDTRLLDYCDKVYEITDGRISLQQRESARNPSE